MPGTPQQTGSIVKKTVIWLIAGALLVGVVVGLLTAKTTEVVKEDAADVSTRLTLDDLAVKLNDFQAANGYYPQALMQLPGYTPPSTPPPVGKADYDYTVAPAGCAGTPEAIAADATVPKCDSFSMSVTLADGKEYAVSDTASPAGE